MLHDIRVGSGKKKDTARVEVVRDKHKGTGGSLNAFCCLGCGLYYPAAREQTRKLGVVLQLSGAIRVPWRCPVSGKDCFPLPTFLASVVSPARLCWTVYVPTPGNKHEERPILPVSIHATQQPHAGSADQTRHTVEPRVPRNVDSQEMKRNEAKEEARRHHPSLLGQSAALSCNLFLTFTPHPFAFPRLSLCIHRSPQTHKVRPVAARPN
ncbi:hypothetical protein VTI28DRAFT_4414 [Corynascus sepedonium]